MKSEDDEQVPDSQKPREVKVYFTPQELAELDEFRLKRTSLRSRNLLFHAALNFYMDSVIKSRGVVNEKNFPVPIAAESISEYQTRAAPESKTKGRR